MIDTVIFDLDGTLLNTLEDLKNSTNFALKKFGFSERTLEEVRIFVGNGLRRLIEQAVPEETDAATVDAVLAAMKAHYQEHCVCKTVPYPGIFELLEHLKSAGFRLAIVSNKAAPMVAQLRKAFFDGQIEIALGESEQLRRKPWPDMVFSAIEQLRSAAERTVYVGDSEVDVQTAKNAGIPCLSVGWGFRSAQVLRRAGVEKIYDTPQALLDALLLLGEVGTVAVHF